MINKPFSQACENNKQPILTILTQVFSSKKHVLEIGSGTGQHAAFFAQHLTHLTWQTSDLLINHEGINLWLEESKCPNIKSPIVIDLNNVCAATLTNLPINGIDGIYTANTLHIVSWPLVVNFFHNIAKHITSKANVCIYGPFNYQVKCTSQRNANFDLWLKARDVNSGIRDIEAVLSLANEVGLKLTDDHEMPANNRLLVFSKT